MATRSELDAILKDDYKEYHENLNNMTFLLAQIEQKKDTVTGRLARHAIHTGRSGAIGAGKENADLPDADKQKHKNLPVPVRTERARIQLTVELLTLAKTNEGAFVDALDSEMGIDKDLMKDVNRQLYGTSNGVMATCGVTTASTTVVLDPTSGFSVMGQLYEGRKVDIGTVANPISIAQAREITAVDETNHTITISGAAVTTTAAAFVFNTAAGGANDNSGTINDGQVELTGLRTIIDDTAVLHTLNPATTSTWKSQVYANAGVARPVPETAIDLAILRNQARSGSTISALLSNAGVFVAGKSILSGYQRNIDTMEFKGGFTGIKWSTPGISGMGGKDIGWQTDHDCPEGMLFGVNFDALVCHMAGEGWQWMDQDGAVLSRVANKLGYEAAMYTLMEVACVRRNAHFVVRDLAEAA